MELINATQSVNLRHEHKHVCPRCKTAWKHSNNMAGNELEHTCPNCGTEQWAKFFTSEDCERLVGISFYCLLQARPMDTRQARIHWEEANQFYNEL